MYDLKTLLPQFEIELPTCMYPMKNVSLNVDPPAPKVTARSRRAACLAAARAANLPINGNNQNDSNNKHTIDTAAAAATPTANCTVASSAPGCVLDLDILGAQIQQILKFSPQQNAILLRQEKLLAEMIDLQHQLKTMRIALENCYDQPWLETLKKVRATNSSGLREEPLHDVVINGHPNFIPYALLAIKNAWRDLYTIDVKTFTHSTMPDIGVEARAFEQALAAVPIDASKPKINVSLIWKNCEHTEMISSPTMYVPIYGEVNIIRYLGRVGPAAYRYEESPLATEIDAVLDICYQLLRCTTAKTRATMLRALNQRLGKQQFFGGEQMSVADIGVHSSLKRMPAIVDKDLTPALSAWRKRAQLVTLL